MNKIQEIIEEYKVQILPNSSEDWQLICMNVAKNYAIQVVQEIADNPDYYMNCSYDEVVASDKEIETLIETIENNNYEHK